MKLAVLKETAPETRVALTPDVISYYQALGCEVFIEHGAGIAGGFNDDAYQTAGAECATSKAVLANADLLLCVGPPKTEILKHLNPHTVLIGLLSQLDEPSFNLAQKQSLHLFAMERIPRISRAQSMDVLSSQSNLAGYKAVIDAVAHFNRVVPMMMTAAGTIRPAKVLVLGAGVAGLQAIATARRLGAVVTVFDVRAAAAEQVKSLGAEFIAVDETASQDAETQEGYAKEMSQDYQARQAELIHTTLKTQNIAICTALIPNKLAPTLITQAMVKAMPQGSVIVDLAVSQGGNCELSQPDKIVEAYGVTILGHSNTPGRVPHDASRLYANNLQHFVSLLINDEVKQIRIDREDDIIKACLLGASHD